MPSVRSIHSPHDREAIQYYLPWLQRAALLIACLAALTLGLQNQGVLLPSVPNSILHVIVILSFELLLASWLLAQLLAVPPTIRKIDTFLFVILFANLIFLRPFLFYYLDDDLSGAPVIGSLQPFLEPAYFMLLGITGVFGIFAFQKIMSLHNNLVDASLRQHQGESIQEEQRRAVFQTKYPRLAALPVVGSLTGFFIGEGIWLMGGLFVLLVIGSILRLWNLDALVPYADEYRHLITAKLLLSGEPLSQIDYRRGLFTVTIPVYLSFRLLGASLWSARFAGVLVNLLAVIPIYLLGKRINKTFALLATGLFLVDPWMVSASRLAREYAYYPFYFTLILLVMVSLLEEIPDGLVLHRQVRSLITLRSILFASILLIALIYAYWIDNLSTFRVISVIYPVMVVVFLFKFDFNDRGNRLIGIIIAASAAILMISLALSSGNPGSVLTGKFNSYFVHLLYDSPSQQIYYQRGSISLVILACAILGTSFFAKGQKTSGVIFLIYLFTLLAFATFTIKDNRPRYGLSLQLWHVLVMAMGLYVSILILKKYFHSLIPWPAGAVLLILVFWNIPYSFTPALHTQSGYAPISEDYHPDLYPAYSYLLAHARPDEPLVTSELFIMYLQWMEGLHVNPIVEYVYDARSPEKALYDAIQSYPSGWIVLDYRTGYLWTRPFLFEDFDYKGKRVHFLGWYGDQYIFRWD